MSLINEALKEAQRERSGRAEPRATAVLVDSFFPYPESGGARRANMPLMLGAVGVVAIIAAGWGVAHLRLKRAAAPIPMSSIATQALLTAPVKSAPAPAPAKAAPTPPAAEANTAAKSATEARIVPPAEAPERTRHETPSVSSEAAARHAAPLATAPVTADSSTRHAAGVQQQSAQSGVHVIVDPVGSADSLFRRAYAEQMRGNFDGATDLYEKAINTGNASADLYNNYGALLARKGNNSAAAEMYGLALKRDELNVNAWVNLAAANDALGRHAEAMSDYAQAAKLDPANGVVKTRLAKEYLAIGDTASARRNYEDALKTSPNEPDVHYAYAAFLEAMHDRAGAIREYQQFIALAPAKYDPGTLAQVKDYVVTLRGRPND